MYAFMYRVAAIGVLLGLSSVAWGVDKTFFVQRVDAFNDNDFDLLVDVGSRVQLLFPDPDIIDTETLPGDDLEYGSTEAEIEVGSLYSRATSIGEAWIDTAISNWSAVGQADVTADVWLKRDDDLSIWMGVPSWAANVVANSHFIVETDEEYDPEFELTLRGYFFIVASGYTVHPTGGFDPAIGTVIVTEIITPQGSRTCTATYNGNSWGWALRDENQDLVDDGGGSGVNELLDFELPVFQGQLIQVRTSIFGGTAAAQWNSDCEDSWAMSASAWFDVVDP